MPDIPMLTRRTAMKRIHPKGIKYLMMVGMMQGFVSPLFAFAVCVDAIVIHAALNVLPGQLRKLLQISGLNIVHQ